MRTAPWICAAVVGGMALAGCGNKDDNKPATPDGKTSSTTDMNTAAGNAASTAGNAGNSMMSGAGNMMSAAGNSMSSAGNSMSASAGNSMSASATGGTSVGDVNASIARIQGYINSKQFDEADAELKRLEANSTNYPPAVQSTIAGLRSTLTAAKSMPTSMPSGLNGLMSH